MIVSRYPYRPSVWKFGSDGPRPPNPVFSDWWRTEAQFYLHEAIEHIGQHDISAWDGTERAARPNYGPPEPPWTYYRSVTELKGYVAFDASGEMQVVSRPEAESWWMSIKDELMDAWRIETEAAERWNRASNIARNHLADGRITAFISTENGKLLEVPRQTWRSKAAPRYIAAGRAQIVELHGYSTFKQEGFLVLDCQEISRLYATTPAPADNEFHQPIDAAKFPYIAFLIRASQEIEFAPGRTAKKIIDHWLRTNWPTSLGAPTQSKLSNLATFLRRPEHERGGVAGLERRNVDTTKRLKTRR